MHNPTVFSDEQIAEIINLINTTKHTQYIGARYVPLFGRKGEDNIEWDSKAPYEPLTIVLHQGNSFTSRQYVPAGIDITDETYWASTGVYNAQIEQYRRETADAMRLAKTNEQNIATNEAEFTRFQQNLPTQMNESFRDNYTKITVIVAASNSSDADKSVAKYVCTGTDDQDTIQTALDDVSNLGGTLHLCTGTYNIDHFRGTTCRAAIRFNTMKQNGVNFEGPFYPQRSRTNKWDPKAGAILKVTAAAMADLGSNLGFVITGYAADANPDVWDRTYYPNSSLNLQNIGIVLADNVHNVTAVDTNAFTVNNVRYVSVGVDKADAELNVKNAAERCIGFRSVLQQQINQRFDGCAVYGTRYGFDVGGEHVVFLQCIAIRCYCGWRFYGTDMTRGGHPLTAIECSDEVCIVGPIFGGASEISAETPIPGMTLINWNREVVQDSASPWYCEQQATETVPGIMRGFISYQISDGAGSYRSTNRIPFFETGHGKQAKILNLTANQSAGIMFEGMPTPSSKSQLLRGDGANVGQIGFATNQSLLRNDFRTDQGIGVPVFWDGSQWRTFNNSLAVKGENLFTCTPGNKEGYEWEKTTYGKEDAIAMRYPQGEKTYVVCNVAHAIVPAGNYEVICPQATGLCYYELVFPSGNVGYTIYDNAPLPITIDADTEITLRINMSTNAFITYREKLVPSLRKIWINNKTA